MGAIHKACTLVGVAHGNRPMLSSVEISSVVRRSCYIHVLHVATCMYMWGVVPKMETILQGGAH